MDTTNQVTLVNDAHGVCPHCGRCPTCGRAPYDAMPIYPYQPWPYQPSPWWNYPTTAAMPQIWPQQTWINTAGRNY